MLTDFMVGHVCLVNTGFPWWYSELEFICQCKRHHLIPSLGRFHAVGQLSLCATATEAHTQQSQQAAATDPPVRHNKSHHSEKPHSPELDSSPHSPQLRKAHTQQQRPGASKIKYINYKKQVLMVSNTFVKTVKKKKVLAQFIIIFLSQSKGNS